MADNDAWGDAPANGEPRRSPPSPRRDDSRAEYSAPPPRGGGGDDVSFNPGNNLHVSGLAQRTTDADLEDIFGKFGKIEKAQIMKDPHTRESRGFGFVTFENSEDAAAAMAALNATTLDDRTITVEKARRGRARTPTPGQYRGPPKRGERDFRGGFDRRDDRRPRYDDRRPSGYGSDPRRDGMYAAPMRDDRRYDDRERDRGGRYDDRPPRFDDRRYDDRPARYDDRPPRGMDDRGSRYDSGGYDDRAPPPRGGGYDDRRGGAPDYGRRERDYDDRRARDYPPPSRAYDEPPRRY